MNEDTQKFPNYREPESYKKQFERQFVFFWLYAVLVSAGCGVILYLLYESIIEPITSYYNIFFGMSLNEYISVTLRLLATLLVCWRVLKVAVLLGSPVSVGITFGELIVENSLKEKIRAPHIGTITKPSLPNTQFTYFLAFLRKHPRSDKLMRYRLQFMMIALPYSRTLVIDESSFFLWKLSPQERFDFACRMYEGVFGKLKA